jgi:predicted DNA-binding protein
MSTYLCKYKITIMATLQHSEIKKFYQNQIKNGVLTIRLDEETKMRLFKLVLITRRSKSDMVREAIFDLIWEKYRHIL